MASAQPPTSTTAPGMGESNPNPASLSMDPRKKVPRNKPQVKPPFQDVSFGRFMTYLTLGLLLLSGYYVWKLTHWAADAGGYWNLATGYRPHTGQAAADAAASAAAAAASANGANDPNASLRAAASGLAAGGDTDAELADVAEKLGYTPEQLKQALKMLNILDPTGDGAEAAAQADAAQAAGAAAGAAAAGVVEEDAEPEPGLLHIIGEALLD